MWSSHPSLLCFPEEEKKTSRFSKPLIKNLDHVITITNPQNILKRRKGVPDGQWKLVSVRFLISNRAICTSSTTSSRFLKNELVLCIIRTKLKWILCQTLHSHSEISEITKIVHHKQIWSRVEQTRLEKS